MSAGYSAPIQSQPQWEDGSMFPQKTAVVPPGLECLVEVEEVILKNKVFQTKDGQDLFTVHREAECCGPSLHLRLRNPYKRDVLSLFLASDGFCCEGDTDLKIRTDHYIGIVNISSSSGNLNVSIQRGNREPVFRARLPQYVNANDSSNIEIFSMKGSQPVAYIIKEKEGRSSQVIFRFPLNMEAALKAVILGAFLYMSFRMREMSQSHSSTDCDDSWATAGGALFSDTNNHHHYSYHENDSGHWGDHHDDSGGHHGDCGGGGWGDEGDCVGGGYDCGSGADDCGGGGYDCGGGADDCGGGADYCGCDD